jgi:Mg2+ and Co2+ transporter CorA
VIRLLGYDSIAVYALTPAQVPEWQQPGGGWLWLQGTAVNESELEEIACLFTFSRRHLRDCQKQDYVAYLDAYHRYIFATLPFIQAAQPERFHLFLGHDFLVTLSSAPLTAVDCWPSCCCNCEPNHVHRRRTHLRMHQSPD